MGNKDDRAIAEVRRIGSIYDELASTWDQRQGFVERKLMGPDMRRALGSKLYGDVLEIGTGTGATFPFVNFDDLNLRTFTGTDISAGMLSEARQAAGPQPKLRLSRMRADALAFPDASFDVVTSSLVLCSVPNLEDALREMSRVCKPGGRVVLLEHVRARNPIVLLAQKVLTPLQERYLGCHLDRPTNRVVRDLGFDVEEEAKRFFGVFVLITARPIDRDGEVASPTRG